MRKGLQSSFGCLKNLKGSTASEPSKLRHFEIAASPLFGFQGAQESLG